MAYEKGVFVTFEDDSIENKRATKQRGYPVYDDVVMVKIQFPNSIDCVPRPLQEADKSKYPKSWEAYLTGKEPAESGYPVSQWAQISRSELKVLQACQVKTVEQLAELPDSGLHRLGPGGVSMKERAKKFVDGAAQIERLQDTIKELERKIEGMSDAQANSEPERRKPKRLKVSSG